MRILGIVPARGGSKRIPGKNLAPLRGKPLIAYTLEVAVACPSISKTIVFTDDHEIAAFSESVGVGVPVERPPELSGDSTPTWPAVQYAFRGMEALDGVRYDAVVILQPTSPLRRVEDVEGAIELFVELDCEAVVSVVKAIHNPYYNMVERRQGNSDRWYHPLSVNARSVANSQAAPEVWALNGAVYVFARDALLNARSQFDIGRYMVYEMPSARSLDIDDPLDLDLADFLMSQQASHRAPSPQL